VGNVLQDLTREGVGFCHSCHNNNGEKVSAVEVGARPAGAAIGGVGSRALAGGRTTSISPDLACALATRSAIMRPLARASHPDRRSAGCRGESGCQAGVGLHAARIARSNAVPHVVRVPCLFFPVCLCSRVQYVASSVAAAPTTPAATPGTHAPVPWHPLEHAAQSALHLRAFRWHVCACVQILSSLLTV